jgi:hypothetical protein
MIQRTRPRPRCAVIAFPDGLETRFGIASQGEDSIRVNSIAVTFNEPATTNFFQEATYDTPRN